MSDFRVPEYWIGQRVLIEQIFEELGGSERIECLIVGFVWEYQDWRVEELRQGWTYFVKILMECSVECTDYIHESDILGFQEVCPD